MFSCHRRRLFDLDKLPGGPSGGGWNKDTYATSWIRSADEITFALSSGSVAVGSRICTFSCRVPFCRLASGAISAT